MRFGMPALVEYTSVEQNVKLCHELGLDFVELNLNFPYCQNVDTSELLSLKIEYGINYTLHFLDNIDFGINIETIRRGYITYFKEVIEKFSKAQIELINIHLELGPIVTLPDTKVYINEQYFSEYCDNLLASIKELKSICDDYNITLAIENMKAAAYFEQLLPLVKEVIPFTYDVGHDYVDGNKYLRLIKDLKLPLTHIHLHDATDKNNHLQLGLGSINIRELLNEITVDDPTIVIEVKTSNALIESVKVLREMV